jgi:hypothetical protein
MILADGLFDFGLQEGLLHIVRIIATIGGAIVGWFVCDPLTRLLYRISFRGATPGPLLLLAKIAGAATLSLLIYFFMPLGGGGGGLGWGPGMGGGPGKGAGSGGDKSGSNDSSKDPKSIDKDKTNPNKQIPQSLEPVEIEIISVKLYADDERFYLLKRAAPAISLEDMESYFKKEATKIELVPILTGQSFDPTQPDNPLSRLLKLAADYKVKTLQTKKM